jgi:hypothetical protein
MQEVAMSNAFIQGGGDWVSYRERFGISKADEVDLHFGRRDRSVKSYDEAMSGIAELVQHSLRKAQENGRPYVMFTHGCSTSRSGQTTARSVVRGFMRSKQATPFIVRAECVQHPTVFIAKIRSRAA